MGDSGQYQGSQAYGQMMSSGTSVNRNTGSLSYSKNVVSLKGVLKSIGLSLDLTYADGLSGSFGLPPNWTWSISFVIPSKSLTTQGQTYVIDPNWADSTGEKSGLKYVNHHGVKFKQIIPSQPLPYQQPGVYGWRFQQSDGATDYYDPAGKLMIHADMFDNFISYRYVNPMADPLTAILSSISDSWGQLVTLDYQPGQCVYVTDPNGGMTTIVTSQQGIKQIKDAMGNLTTFSYQSFKSRQVLYAINDPSSLVTQAFYTQLPYLDQTGATQYAPAVQDLYQKTVGNAILAHTTYRYGTASNGSTYTGIALHYRMGGSRDNLMEGNNLNYRYDASTAF